MCRLPRSAFFVAALAFLWSVLAAEAAERVEVFRPEEPIPRRNQKTSSAYETWSLFLPNDPEWLLSQSDVNVRDLYARFKDFGDAIGPENAALWFWSRQPRWDEKLFRSVDVLRAAAFCRSLSLPPGKGPYVIVTSIFPGEARLDAYPKTFPVDLKEFSVIELGGADSAEIGRLLSELEAKLRAGRRVADDSGRPDFWTAFASAVEEVRNSLVSFSSRITVLIKAPGVEVKITGAP